MKLGNSLGLGGLPIPESKNSAPAITNFEERAFIDYNQNTSQTVDIRTQKSMFGRIDEFNNAIFPDVDKVKFNPQLGVFGFDFVFTLISQFAQECESLGNNVSQYSVYKNSAFTNKNFRSIEESFQSYYQELFEDFRRDLFDTGEEVNITGFGDYV